MSDALPAALPIQALSFVALDLETTGIAPGFDRVVEVAAVRFRLGADLAVRPGPVFHAFVDPGRPLPEVTRRLTGLTDAELADAPTMAALWPDLAGFLAGGDGPTALVAHNGKVDLAFLVAEAHRAEIPFAPPTTFCTLQLARQALPGAPRYRLSDLVRWLGLAGDGAAFHRARPDALHARNLFARCVGALGARTTADLRSGGPLAPPTPADFQVHVPDHLVPLERRMLEALPVEITYRGGSKGTSARPVTPLCFYRSEGVLYLRAWCHLDDEAKSFRCDRIRTIRA